MDPIAGMELQIIVIPVSTILAESELTFSYPSLRHWLANIEFEAVPNGVGGVE